MCSACITSVMRLAESIRSLNNQDISVSLVPISLWALAEVSAGLVVSCLPFLPRFFGHRNARTRVQASAPSEDSNRSYTNRLRLRVDEYTSSIHSHASILPPPARGETSIEMNRRLNQTSSDV